MTKYVFTIGFEDSKKAVAFEQSLALMGLKYIRKDIEDNKVDTTVMPKKAEAPAPKKESAPKKDTKAKDVAPKKAEDGFDRDLYERLSKHFGVATKKGCARFARQTMYDAMSTVQKSKKGTLTKTAEKAIWKQLMAEAARFGEAWAIAMVEQAYAQAQ